MNKFSFYRGPISNLTPEAALTTKQVAESIKSDKELNALTSELRAIKTEEGKKKFKAARLPYVTFSGIFNKRNDKELVKHSGLIAIDMDHIGTNGEIETIKKKIGEHYEPAIMFTSPRGNGLKVVFKVDINTGEHNEYFAAINSFLTTDIKVEVDKGAKAISQACFLCADSEVYYNDNPTTLNREFLAKYQPAIKLTADMVTNDDASQYEAAKKWLDEQETFIKGNRNNYLTRLSSTCNRYGVSESYTLSQLRQFTETDLAVNEIEGIVRSVYKHTERHNIADGITPLSKKGNEKIDKTFIRVGTNFFKIIKRTNRYGVKETYLKPWNKDTILQDYKRRALHFIPTYDEFVMVPDNVNYKAVINNGYNLYAPLNHTPAPGKWLWTERLLKHVFGEQYEVGIRYMQILYLYPAKSTIILVLVSKERGTGKTTFVNWINMLFGANVAPISSSDFLSGFNSHYATKNIITIEETLFDKKLTIEKLKALATAKQVQINEKFVSPYTIPYYGKVILTSNHETRFAQIDQEEIRFLVRKLETPEFTNHSIEDNLLEEIPAFLNYLLSLPLVDWSISRSGFTPEELTNNNLDEVIKESRSGLYEELNVLITDFFDNNEIEEFKATIKDVKDKFFYSDSHISLRYIRRVLKDEFNMTPEGNQKYYPWEDSMGILKTGRPYLFNRNKFNDDDEENPFFR